MVVSSEERFLTFSTCLACIPDSTVACTSNSLFTLPALGDSRLTALVVECGSVGSGGLGTGFEKQQPILLQAQKKGEDLGEVPCHVAVQWYMHVENSP